MMSTSSITPAKRIGLAFSGLVYMFAAPFIVSQGVLLTAFWILVGFGLARQLFVGAGLTHHRWPAGRRVLRAAPELAEAVQMPGAALGEPRSA